MENEILSPSELDSDQLKYSVVGYSTNIQVAFGDTGAQHSPIIGWAYDGNPIYGPYGYDDPTDVNSASSLVTVGYAASASMIADRPVGFWYWILCKRLLLGWIWRFRWK